MSLPKGEEKYQMNCPICGKPMKRVAEDSLSRSWRCQDKECSIEKLAVRADRPGKVEEEVPHDKERS